MNLLGLLLPLALVLLLGAWLQLRGTGYAAAVGAFVALAVGGCVAFVLLGKPHERIARVGGSILMALPLVGAAAVAFNGRLWRWPWAVVLLAAAAYAVGLLVGFSVWDALDLPS